MILLNAPITLVLELHDILIKPMPMIDLMRPAQTIAGGDFDANTPKICCQRAV